MAALQMQMSGQQGAVAHRSATHSLGMNVPISMCQCPPPCAAFSTSTSGNSQRAAISHKRRDRAGRRSLVSVSATPAQQQEQQGLVQSKGARSTYRPESFGEMVTDAVTCCKQAIKDGLTRVEVEFPPVPVKLDGYKGSSDLFIDSNITLALAAARQLAEDGRRVHIVMPDQGEYDRGFKLYKASLGALGNNISFGHLREAQEGFSFGGLITSISIDSIINGHAPSSKVAGEQANTYLVINATCTELINVREYIELRAPAGGGKVAMLWNLELDSLRGDMGLPAFPSKDMQYTFLAAFRPIFYLRPRDYSKSVAVAPFLVNYSGALFREYPGPWQVMLKQDNGEYACIAEDRVRYNLGELKEELQAAMGLATEVEGSAMQVLRRGVKNSTWWEDDYEVEKSHEWRL